MSARRGGAGFRTAAVAVVACVSMTAGCATTVPGTAVIASDAPIAQLNTGNFTTSVRTPDAGPVQRRMQAANLLAEHMPYAWEVDGRFTETVGIGVVGTYGARALTNSDNLKLGVLDDPAADALGKRGMIYGFSSGRREPGAADANSSGLAVTVVRMVDDGAASGFLDDYRRIQPGVRAAAGHPEIVVDAGAMKAGRTVVVAVSVSGPLVIIVFSKAEPAAAESNAVRAQELQKRMSTGFSSPGADGVATLTMDRDGIVGRTVAPGSEIVRGYLGHGYLEDRAQRHWQSVAVNAGFDDAGVDLTGAGLNTVYRARDAAGAERLVNTLATAIDHGGYPGLRSFSVDGLPAAKCSMWAMTTSPEPRYAACYVAVGRYVSAYADYVPAAKAAQVTSAAYLVLRNAR